MRRVFPFFAALLIVASCACREKITVLPPPPGASTPPTGAGYPPVESAPVEADPGPSVKLLPPPGPLATGEMYLRQGKYAEAVRSYEAALISNPGNGSMDGILFNLSLARALSPNPESNLPEAKTALNRLISEYPDSLYKSQAELILSLIAQVEKLNRDVRQRDSSIRKLREELKRLKEIDMERRPSRPQ
ncbi:MAG: tetratricopeptide repeat protein [Acidobacteria bacterium]|nr:tetratricopeptide repeat protein [Acidobacteriota bacterium]